jgi:Secretion system C-terminal sorting domain
MKKLYHTGLFVCISLVSMAQSNVTATGGEATGVGGSVSYSVGQIDYINSSGSNGSISQGVQQPYEFFLVGMSEIGILSLNLYPNPTSEFVILELDAVKDNLVFQLFDLKGKLIRSESITESKTHIQMGNLASGEYQLSILHNNNQIELIKIIKHH